MVRRSVGILRTSREIPNCILAVFSSRQNIRNGCQLRCRRRSPLDRQIRPTSPPTRRSRKDGTYRTRVATPFRSVLRPGTETVHHGRFRESHKVNNRWRGRVRVADRNLQKYTPEVPYRPRDLWERQSFQIYVRNSFILSRRNHVWS